VARRPPFIFERREEKTLKLSCGNTSSKEFRKWRLSEFVSQLIKAYRGSNQVKRKYALKNYGEMYRSIYEVSIICSYFDMENEISRIQRALL
jgi:hypothetical protein